MRLAHNKDRRGLVSAAWYARGKGLTLSQMMRAERDAMKRAVTDGMRVTGMGLKDMLRGQLRDAGMGERIGKTIRDKTFPEGAKKSLNAAGTVWSKAPQVIRAFDEGVEITAQGGKYLAIPLPQAGRARGGRRMKPQQAIDKYGKPRAVPLRDGKGFVWLFRVAHNIKRTGWAKRTKRRIARGDDAGWIAMFVLVPRVRLRKRIAVEIAVGAAMLALPGNIAARWPKDDPL